MTRSLQAAAVCVASLGLTACGGPSDEEKVEDVIVQLADSDPKVCDKTTDRFVKDLGGSREQCRKSAREDNGLAKSKVGKITVDGDKATAVLSAQGGKATFSLIKDGDTWELDRVR